MLVAQLSDTHVAAPGTGLLRFVDGRARLAAALTHIDAMQPRPDVLLLTGDLTDHGTAEEYALLRELVDGAAVPTFMIPGNHDERTPLVDAFPHHTYLPRDGGPLAYVIDEHPVRLVGVDTLRDGYHDGELDPARLAWLDDQLGRAPGTPTFVFMHHPAFTTGIWWMDATPLLGRAGFWEVIGGHPQVVQVVAGHVHHHASTQVGATSCTTAPGTSYQLLLELDPEASPKITDRAGPVLLYDVGTDGCVVHESPYLTDGTQVLDFARIVPDYPTFAAKLRAGTGFAKDGFGM